jgi:hypothetical protein
MERKVISQYVLESKSVSKSNDFFANAVSIDLKHIHRSPCFVAEDGLVRVRIPGGKEEWSSIKLTTGEEFTFEKVINYEITGLSGKPKDSIFKDEKGKPFLWLGDTVWFGLTDRVSSSDWKSLMLKRTREGFNVMQVVAGLLPETSFGHANSLLKGRTSWLSDKSEIDPRWWDAADKRIIDAVKSGQMPAIVGAWSYYILDFGPEKLKRHWREIVARWSALPVFWCVAGEVGLMHYENLFDDDMAGRALAIQQTWRPVVEYVRVIDPNHRPVTVHPCPAFNFSSIEALQGDKEIDFVWLQTGHADANSIKASLVALNNSQKASQLPVLNSEVCYEGIAGGSPAMLQRYLFWSHILQGATGHTYGAQGLWAFHTDKSSPGAMWGWVKWQDAARLPGSKQLGMAAKYLRKLGWTGFTPAQEMLIPHADLEHSFRPWVGKMGDYLVAYFPAVCMAPSEIGISTDLSKIQYQNLKGGGKYSLEIFNPRNGKIERTETIIAEKDGTWMFKSKEFISALPTMEDWVVVLKKVKK